MKIVYLLAATSMAGFVQIQPASAQELQAAPADQAPPASATTAAQAAPDGTGIADIIVTAQRREESLQRVPIAVTALGQRTLETRGITSLTNLSTSIAPGLTVIPFAGSPTTLSFNIRGASQGDPGTGLTEQGVAVYVDGVPIGRASGAGIELGDVERIEVLRGPQGTLFGRNAEGGAIQYITKRPTGEFHAKLDGTYGNYGAYRILGQVEFPLTDTLAFKIGGLIDKHDGYVKNKALSPGDTLSPSDHKDFADYDNKGFRAAVQWKPSSRFNAYYSFDYTDTRFTDFYTVRTGSRTPSELGFCAVPSFAIYCATPQSIAANVYTGTQQPENPGVKTSAFPIYNPGNIDRIRGNSLVLSYDASDHLKLKSITGYRTLAENLTATLGSALPFVQFVPSSLFDGDAANGEVPPGTTVGASGSVATARIRQHQFSQEVQAIGSFGRIEFTTGAFYYHEKVNDQRNTLFDLAYVSVGQPQPAVFAVTPFPLTPSLVGYDASADSYAGYFQGSWTPDVLDDRLKLTGGIRYTHDKKHFLRSISDYNPAQLGSTSTFKNGRFDPAFIIAYRLNDQINFYGKYGSAYRAGGTQIRNKLALTTYSPEVNKTFEIGAKSDLLDHHVRWDVAAFHSRIDGRQVDIQNLPGDPSSSNTVNADGPVIIKGIESELTIAPVTGLVFGVNYSYQHARGPKFVQGAPFSLPGVPKNSLQLSADYATPVYGDVKLAIHGEYNYLSHYLSSTGYLPPIFTAPTSLSVFNARVAVEGIALGGAKAELSVFGRNLSNKHDFSYTFSSPTSDFTLNPIGGAGNVIAPRTYGLELRIEI